MPSSRPGPRTRAAEPLETAANDCHRLRSILRTPGFERRLWLASLPLALGRLRQRVQAGIALRYLIDDGGAGPALPFERVRGHIDAGGVVIDGRLIPWNEFSQLLASHEGWEFDLRIPGEPDW